MKQQIENIIKKWLKEHKDGGNWVTDYDGDFDLDSCCLDGYFNLSELSDEVLKVVEKSKNLTMTELMMLERNDNYYQTIKKHLKKILDFVERYNKQDQEKDIANSAQFLEQLLNKTISPIKENKNNG